MSPNTCRNCLSPFEITDSDLAYYQKVQVPKPKLCPVCRSQRRMASANLMNLYKRKSDFSGNEIVTHYHAQVPFPVYEQELIFSDKLDATKYGQDYDFGKPFFDQYKELSLKVPRSSRLSEFGFDENCDFTNHAGKNKNCYMLFDSDQNHDCMYGTGNSASKNCLDNYRIHTNELCYECIDCTNSYSLLFSQDCDNCSNSAFLKNCIGCRDCFMSSNIKNKQYYLFNKQATKEEFEQYLQSLRSYAKTEEFKKYYSKYIQNFPQRYLHGIKYENVTGDHLVQCKNAEQCFDSWGLWDCKYHNKAFGPSRDCMDCDEVGDQAELMYECAYCGYNSLNCKFTIKSLGNISELQYCLHSPDSKNCFGCISVYHKQYCILNKQYTKEEYESLLPRIIEHMNQTGEYGEFFPVQLSDFAYNESDAQEWYPLTKDEALAKGYRWRDPDPKEYLPASIQVADNINEVQTDLLSHILACQTCGRNYKIIAQELKFYQQLNLPIPRLCFYCRHKNRHNKRNKRVLYDRTCDKCGIAINTTYETGRPEKIYCENCYQSSLE